MYVCNGHMYVMDVHMITPLNRANDSKCPKISSHATTTTQLTHAHPTMHCIHLVLTSNPPTGPGYGASLVYIYNIYRTYVHCTLTNFKEIFLNSQSKIPSQNHILLMNTSLLLSTFYLKFPPPPPHFHHEPMNDFNPPIVYIRCDNEFVITTIKFSNQ